MNGFLIAAPASGCGKTTVALSISAALSARGLNVQAFKCGPDFLDTSLLSAVTGRPARNLDSWMLDKQALLACFDEASFGADVAVVEGMMGLFDGVSGKGEHGSAAEVAKLLSLPVILVVDASSAGRSIAATIRGFEVFDPALHIAGIIFNGVAGENHLRLLKDATAAQSSAPILGWLTREASLTVPERHLGVHMAHEVDWTLMRQSMTPMAEKHLQMDYLLTDTFPLPTSDFSPSPVIPKKQIRLGVARDAAFCFCYQDNLDLLERAGAAITFFSPLQDAKLPEGIDALYLCGGYPELHAAQLSGNSSMAQSVRDFAVTGGAIYAECGGMIYLSNTLKTTDGFNYPMAGVLPLSVEMTNTLQQFGYVEAELNQDSIPGPAGLCVRGHSFHYSRITASEEMPTAFRAHYTLSGTTREEGWVRNNVLASYLHLHFRSDVRLAENFVKFAATATQANAGAV